jgi:carbon starvation protein CstA
MDDYPALNFLMEHARSVAAAAAVLPLAGAIVAVAAGASPLWLVAGIVAAAVGYGLVRSYVELIKLVTDMLMPK